MMASTRESRWFLAALGSRTAVRLAATAVLVLFVSVASADAAPIETLPAGSHPGALALDPTETHAYVVNNDHQAGDSNRLDTVSEVDLRTGAVTATIATGSYARVLSSIAIEPAGNFAYVVGSSSASPFRAVLIKIDLASHAVVSATTIAGQG